MTKQFKRLNSLFVAFLIIVFSFLSIIHASADNTNLVNNGSFSQVDPTTGNSPLGWSSESWGSNTATFDYQTTGGYVDGPYVQTQIADYQSGDGKWIFDSVSVMPGSEYVYSDWYESDVATNVWAQYTLGDGTVQYQWLGGLVPTSNWEFADETFTIPTNVVNVTVYHVLSADGQLSVSNVGLSIDTPCLPTSTNGLVNGNFSQVCPDNPNLPAGWQPQTYGPDPASYSYTTNSSGSDTININNASANDEAGWTTNVLSPLSNQRYQLSFEQMGTTYVYAYLNETLDDGTTQSINLMSAPATSGIYGTTTPVWSEYTDNFTTANVQSMTLTIATSGIGSLSISNVGLAPLSNQTPENWNSGMVSITLDDNFYSQYENALPTLEQYGFKGTFYVNAGTLNDSGYMTSDELKQVASDGNEIASHMYHLSDMVEIDTPTLVSELTGNTASLQNILGKKYQITDFADPYGSYVSSDLPTVMEYEQSDRTTDGEINTKANLNIEQIHAKLVLPTTTLSQVESWVAQAQADHDWLVLVYHGVTTTPSSTEESEYSITPTQFSQQISAIAATRIKVEPINRSLESLLAQ